MKQHIGFILKISVIVVSMSEVFHKLIIINKCLRIILAQGRLSGLAILYNEDEMALESAEGKLRKADFV
jgi:hypothetical protein